MRIWLPRRERPVEAPKPAPETESGPEPVDEPETQPALALAPPPPPEPGRTPEPEPEPLPVVVPLALRDQTPRAWNLWELERVAAGLGRDAASEERSLLLLHLRQFADPAGDLPDEFDSLVREAFGANLAALPR
jgi:hypothetical protein